MENKTAVMHRVYLSEKEIKELLQLGVAFDLNKGYAIFNGLHIELSRIQKANIQSFFDNYNITAVSNANFLKNANILQDSFGNFSKKKAAELVKTGKWFYTDEKLNRIHNGKLSYKVVK